MLSDFMDVKIIEKRDSPFFKRKELKISIKHDSTTTPSKADIQKDLAVSEQVDESQVVVDFVSTKKGICESVASVKILNEKPPAEKTEEKKEDDPAEKPAEKPAEAKEGQ